MVVPDYEKYIHKYISKKTREPREIEFIEGHSVDKRYMKSLDLRDIFSTAIFDDDVNKALAELPVKFRTTIILHDVEEWTYQDIAEFMEIPLGSVRSRLHRARKSVGRQLLTYAGERGYGIYSSQ